MGIEESRPLAPAGSLNPSATKGKTRKAYILSGRDINSLPPNQHLIGKVILSYNQYHQIPTGITDALITYDNLVTIDFSHNFLKSFPDPVLELPTLKIVNLFDNQIKLVNVSNSNILELDLGKNKITEAPQLPPTIEYLSMDMNLLTSINFASETITKLSLSKNHIKKIGSNFNFPQLLHLNISDNELESLPDFSIYAPQLSVLNASNNKIKDFPLFYTSIETINLSNNQISSLPESIAELKQLIYLDLNHNNISHIPPLPSSIEFLNLSFNVIATTADTHFKNCTVNISHNKLTEMTSVIGKSVNASFNSISSVNPFQIVKIESLNLTGNQLSTVQQEVLASPSLLKLLLSRNKIESINLPSDSPLRILDLSFNNLKAAPATLPKSIERLYLHHCNLSVIPRDYSNYQELVTLVISNNNIKELPFLDVEELFASENQLMSPPQFGKRIKTIDLSFNKLSTTFKIPTTCKFVDLSCNNIENIPRIPSRTKSIKMAFNASFKDKIASDTIEHIDLLETPATFHVGNEARVVTSDQTQMSYSQRIGYAGERGSGCWAEDIIIGKAVGDVYLIGIIENSSVAEEASEKLQRMLPQMKFDEGYIRTCIKENIKSDEVQFAFIMSQGNKLYVVEKGNERIALIGPNSCKFVGLNETVNYGESIVYGGEEVSIRQIEAQKGERYAVLLSSRIGKEIDEAILKDSVSNDNTSTMRIAAQIRNAGRITLEDGNLSVAVLDLTGPTPKQVIAPKVTKKKMSPRKKIVAGKKVVRAPVRKTQKKSI